MATASFTKNFAVKSKNDAKKLVKAYETSKPMNTALSKPVSFLNAKQLKERIKVN